jgi:hypothetical protein
MNGDREATTSSKRKETPLVGSIDLTGGIVAFRADGGLYRGDLLADIFGYRELRGRCVRGDEMTEVELVCMTELERKLTRADPDDPESDDRPGRRKFYRFRCDLPGLLIPHGTEPAAQARVMNIGAGGVRIVCDASMLVGDPCKLVLEREEKGGTRMLALPSRVTWLDGKLIGLSFAGAPGYEEDAEA